jgi:5-methylcytosine-specific restriction endonuclease McrA
MSNILDSLEVLKLNANNQPIRLETPRVIFGDLATYMVDERTGELIHDKGGNKLRKMMAYNIDFVQNPNGTYDFDQVTEFRLVDWDDWVKLPVRSFDVYVATANTRIRIPRVVKVLKYDKMPKKKFSLNFKTVYEMYKGVCAYTKKKLKKTEANMDHVIPESKGGKTSWDNIVLCDKSINSKKGNRYNHEVGLPDPDFKIPQEIPMINYLKNEKGIPEWNFFLKNDEG